MFESGFQTIACFLCFHHDFFREEPGSFDPGRIVKRGEGMQGPTLDLGGGVGVDYVGGATPDFTNYGVLVKRIFQDKGFNLGFEPGRAIVAHNGVLLSEVIYVKQSENKRFIIVDAAMNDLIRPTLYEAHHNIEPLKDIGPATGLADVVGPVCETADSFGAGFEVNATSGDFLAVYSAGAYGSSMGSNYNTRLKPAEILVDEENHKVIRKAETFDDLIKEEEI